METKTSINHQNPPDVKPVLNAAAIDCIVKELNKLQKYRNGIKVSNLSENTGHLLFRDVIKTLKRLGGCV